MIKITLNGETFANTLNARQENTTILSVPKTAISFYSGNYDDVSGTIALLRLNGDKVMRRTLNVPSTEQIDNATEHIGTHIFVRYRNVYYPLAYVAKMSVTNRGHCSFRQDITGGNALLLSAFLEDSLLKESSEKVQLIIVDNRCIGIMSGRYHFVKQYDLVQKVLDTLQNGNLTLPELVGGCIDDTMQTALINVNKPFYSKGLAGETHVLVVNSENGYSGVRVTPVAVLKNRQYTLIDDSFYSIHKKDIDLDTGISLMFTDFDKSVEMIAEYNNFKPQYPLLFLEHLIKELNKLNGSLSTNMTTSTPSNNNTTASVDLTDAEDFKKAWKKERKGKKFDKKIKDLFHNAVEVLFDDGAEHTAIEIIDTMLDVCSNISNSSDGEKYVKTILRFVQIEPSALDKI